MEVITSWELRRGRAVPSLSRPTTSTAPTVTAAAAVATTVAIATPAATVTAQATTLVATRPADDDGFIDIESILSKPDRKIASPAAGSRSNASVLEQATWSAERFIASFTIKDAPLRSRYETLASTRS